ncbi:hypothetical protein [Bradyrhizobium sp. dw_411]|uniref:hypothetical protein n=1 Tax=Bradyrhizobium sp. dw_411 TaxID=2720082 RepID=UPI001BCF63E5|nr:hypothetical protein [Bradyrhizobium sp. dw_411]
MGAGGASLEAPAVPADVAAASVRKAELMANPEWRGKYLENDATARAEMTALHQVILGTNPDAGPIDPHAQEHSSDVLEHAREMGVSEEVVQQIKEGKPVSQFEHDSVQRWKNSHMKDPAFLSKFFDGDFEARKQVFLANVTLSLPIKQA